MKVKDVMRTDIVTIPHTATYHEAAHVLHSTDHIGVPIVDGDHNIIGMISEKDLFRVLYPYYQSYYKHPESYTDFEHRESKIDDIKNDPVTKFMLKKVITTGPKVPVMKAGAKMLAQGMNSIPVLDESGELVGILDRKCLYHKFIYNHLGL